MNDNSYKVIEVDINEILPNRFQPRIQFDEEEILELSDSIKEHGVIQPIVVRTIGDKYEIIAGERRYKASVLAGKETVPVIIKNLNDRDSAEIALIENIQRKNLTPIEEALSYKKILDMGYLTQENLASKLGKSQSSVANKIRLLNLSDDVQEALLDNKISERHARSLLKLKLMADQNTMLDRIITERLTVRKTDEEIRKMLNLPLTKEKLEEKEERKEKGEINMNNEMNQIPSIETPQGNTFDIFGGVQPVQGNVPVESPVSIPITPIMEPSTPVVPEPMVAPVPEVPSVPVMPTMEPSTPVVPEPVVTPVSEVPSIPVMPTMEPSTPVVPEPMVAPVPEVPSVPVIPTMEPSTPVVPEPMVAPVPEVPSVPPMSGIQFDANGTVISVTPSIPESGVSEIQNFQTNSFVETTQPSVESMIEPQFVLETSPIIDSNTLNYSTINNVEPVPAVVEPMVSPVMEVPNVPVMSTVEPVQATNEFVASEPIIVTDFDKQYDPIIPNSTMDVQSKVDFKEIIGIIRECSQKIEQYGYKIDVEEYDLSTLYQVVFKIEK